MTDTAVKPVRTRKKAAPKLTAPTPVHQWTNGGDEVLILRLVGEGGISYNGFVWPLTVGAETVAPDARDDNECGGGLHGWPWGQGIGTGKEPDWSATWIVFGSAPADIRLIDDNGDGIKVKSVGKCTVRFVGNFHNALHFVLAGRQAWTFQNSSGSASNSGSRGSASNSGDSGSASNSGDSGSASNSGSSGSASNSGSRGSASNSGYSGSASNSGYRGSASNSGYSGSASNSGDSGSASNSGYSGSASNSGSRGSASATGAASAAISTGHEGKAMAGEYGCIALAWWNSKDRRFEMRCRETGTTVENLAEGKLKPNVFYMLDSMGNFVEAA